MRSTIYALLLAVLGPALIQASTLRGVVTDGSNPVPNANVYVYAASPRVGMSPFCPTCYRDCTKRTTADDRGRFTIAEVDSSLTFELMATATGFKTQRTRLIDPLRGEVEIALVRRKTSDEERMIRGRVVDDDGKPRRGARVEPSGYRMRDGIGFGRFLDWSCFRSRMKTGVSN